MPDDEELPFDLVDSPVIKAALESFVVAAVSEAEDTLKHGSVAAKTALMKMVLGEAFKARGNKADAEAEKANEQTRQLISDMVMGDVGDVSGETEGDDPDLIP